MPDSLSLSLSLSLSSGINACTALENPDDASSYESQINQYTRKCEELGKYLAEAQAYADRCTVVYVVNVFASSPQVYRSMYSQCLASILLERRKSMLNMVLQVRRRKLGASLRSRSTRF